MAAGGDVTRVKAMVGEIMEGVLERVVRNRVERSPLDNAINGAFNIRGKVDGGAKGGEESKVGGSRGEASKMPVVEGKYNEKRWEGYGRESMGARLHREGMGGTGQRTIWRLTRTVID